MIEALQRVVAGKAPVFLLIAGPNGAGKSTFRDRRLDPLGFPCIDPDEVGRQMLGRHPATTGEALRATEEATRRVRQHFAEGRSVALETVFSDAKGYKLALLNEARAAGFRTVLVFIGVDHSQVSIARVMDRVKQGGHDVPDALIEDRFPRCFDNLKKGIAIADLTILVDNTGSYGDQGPNAEGLRHYVFGVVENAKAVKISAQVPAWYTQYGIFEAIQPKSD